MHLEEEEIFYRHVKFADGYTLTVGNNAKLTLGNNTPLVIGEGSTIKVGKGTTSKPPVLFQKGPDLETAKPGAMEFDGSTLLFTPNGEQRGVVPGMQFIRIWNPIEGHSGPGKQRMFNSGCELSANRVYVFEIVHHMERNSGFDFTQHYEPHYLNIGFDGPSGSDIAGFYNIIVTQMGLSPTNGPFGNFFYGNAPFERRATEGIDFRLCSITTFIKGQVTTTSSGVFTPTYSIDYDNGRDEYHGASGHYTTTYGSYCLIYPVSLKSGEDVKIGTWT